MIETRPLAVLSAAALALAGCMETPRETAGAPGPVLASADQELACRDAVTAQVEGFAPPTSPAIISSEGAGDDRALTLTHPAREGSWRCVATVDGDVTDLRYSAG